MGCVSHTEYAAHGNSKGEAISRYENNSRIIGTVIIKGKSHKQGLTSTEDVTI